MAKDKQDFNFRDRYGQFIIVAFLILTGLTLLFAPKPNIGLLHDTLIAIGLNCLSSAAISIIIFLLVGSEVGGLRIQITHLEGEVDKLHGIIEHEADAMSKNIGRLATLLTHASSMGIIGIGRSGQSPVFEGNKNFIERWKYLLEHAHKVDVICFADRSLFSYHVFDHFFKEKIKTRIKQEGEDGLKLRIIISHEENPFNIGISEWSGDPNYTESRIQSAKNILLELCGGRLTPNIVREHQSIVPFTLLRGDDYMYVMFFIPGYAGGPVIEIRPLEMLAYPRITDVEDEKKFFHIYKSYFEKMWENNAPQTTAQVTISKP